MSETRPWRDESRLRELYLERDLTSHEMGDLLGCSSNTVARWLREYGIIEESRPWRDADKLRERYIGQEKSALEIAQEWPCAKSTVQDWLDRHDIPTRKSTRDKPPNFRTALHGYEQVRSAGDEVLIHRLIAVSEYGFGEVAGKHVHHKNGCTFDNRPSNLKPIDRSEHIAKHHEEGHYDDHLEKVHSNREPGGEFAPHTGEADD